MSKRSARLVCQGCGYEVPRGDALTFRCPQQLGGDDTDHLLAAVWSGEDLADRSGDENPFVDFRRDLFSFAMAREAGMTDADFVELVRELDQRIAYVDGHGFQKTPLAWSAGMGAWYKDETCNVGGSHKARHLFGIALYLEVAKRIGTLQVDPLASPTPTWAIASCGNAALAAAVVAKAMDRHLEVYIPSWADAKVVEQLRGLGAEIITCERAPGLPPGDPCFHAFRAAVAAGAIPFTCQGTENGLVIDGGQTLGFEFAEQLSQGSGPPLEHLFLQIGGGAFASATCQALERSLGPHGTMPAIHAVQTRGCHPIAHAWRQLALDLRQALVASGCKAVSLAERDDAGLARWLLQFGNEAAIQRVFAKAKRQRSRYMRPVPAPAASLATGILDDETYDWFAICSAMIRTGGWPIVVSEQDLTLAVEQGRNETGCPVCPTGSAGLAGLLVARREGQLAPGAQAGVVFTGVER